MKKWLESVWNRRDKKMDDNEIFRNIIEFKAKVKELVSKIQNLKKQLERSEISLDDFRERKKKFEEELRSILKKIARFKEKADLDDTSSHLEKPRIEPIPFEKLKEEKEKQSKRELIQKETLLAEEAKDLMFYFQTEFEENITNAKVYLSVTIDDHYVIGVDFSNYPNRPIIKLPSSILNRFEKENIDIYDQIDIYKNWDSNEPAKIYELIGNIESILIENFHADIKTLEKKSEEYIENTAVKINTLKRDVKQHIMNKKYESAKKTCYMIVDLAYNIQDYETASIYTKKINQIQKRQQDGI